MQNAKHTPGPWTASGEHDRETITSDKVNQYGNFIVTIVSRCDEPMTEEDRANARLIAASPDLLDALITLLFACRDGAVLPRDSAHAQARAAIAKASPCSHNAMVENLLPDGTVAPGS